MDLAVRAVLAGGGAAMPWYGRVGWEAKADRSPVTAADHAANDAILELLAREASADAVLSEESHDRTPRLATDRVWIVDPLDGTREFLAGNGEFAVMVGLARAGRSVAGAVYAPALDLLMCAAEGAGAWIVRAGEWVPLRCGAAGDPLRMVGSRSHADPATERLRESLGATVRVSGSVGLKCGLIARGEADVYVHPVPYLKEWDTCAPEIILREAGGVVTDCVGGPLAYNKSDTAQPLGIAAAVAAAHRQVIREVSPLFRSPIGNPVG